MRTAVASQEQPIYSGYEALRNDAHSQLTYRPAGAFEEIGRNPNVHTDEFDNDSNAAYQCAVMGHITGEKAYFGITATILDRWAATLKRITGADAILCAGLGGFKMANAAELLRYSDAGWPKSSAEKVGEMLQQVFVPVLRTFAPFANGNWDTAAMKTLMAIAIYRDDRELFERVLVYYNHGCGDGRLENYVYSNGQCQESGRDQQHTQLGLAHMGDCCEMAWHQGLDLYGMVDNRLLKGFEYTAKYILGGEVPFVPDTDKTGQYHHEIISPRSPLRPVYEQIYNHYVHRRGLPAPWVSKAAAQLRPEGPGFRADHTGFGTLLYSRSQGLDIAGSLRVGRPSGLYAATEPSGQVLLSWVPTAVSEPYVVIRNDGSTSASRNFKSTAPELIDRAVSRGQRYRYKVALQERARRTSLPVSVVAGLPARWTTSDGDLGSAVFDGNVWRVSAAGDSFFTVATTIADGQALIACLHRQFASQFLRAGLELKHQHGSARIVVEPTDPHHGRGWSIRLYQMNSTEPSCIDEKHLEPPFVSYNRIDRPIWFKLGVHGRQILGAFSGDGAVWTNLKPAETLSSDHWQCGPSVNSGIAGVSTEILMNQITPGSATHG